MVGSPPRVTHARVLVDLPNHGRGVVLILWAPGTSARYLIPIDKQRREHERALDRIRWRKIR